MLYGLKEKDIEHIKMIFQKNHRVDKVILYGSRAKGNYKDASDIDLTLIGSNLNLKELNSIELQLDDLMLPYKFDISIFNQISNPDLVDHINRVGKTLFSR